MELPVYWMRRRLLFLSFSSYKEILWIDRKTVPISLEKWGNQWQEKKVSKVLSSRFLVFYLERNNSVIHRSQQKEGFPPGRWNYSIRISRVLVQSIQWPQNTGFRHWIRKIGRFRPTWSSWSISHFWHEIEIPISSLVLIPGNPSFWQQISTCAFGWIWILPASMPDRGPTLVAKMSTPVQIELGPQQKFTNLLCERIPFSALDWNRAFSWSLNCERRLIPSWLYFFALNSSSVPVARIE